MMSRGHNDSLLPLKILAILSVVAPLFIYGAIGLFRFDEASREAEQRVSRSLRVAHEHAIKVVGGAEALQDRLVDLLRGKSVDELRAQEPALHALLAARVQGQQQIQSIWIIGADGKPIASSLFSPPPAMEFSDRPYFIHHRSTAAARYLSEPFNSRSTGERVIDISSRFDDAQGRFAGVVNISLYTSYFTRYYADIVADEPGLAVNMFTAAGSVAARHPVPPGQAASARMGPTSPVLASIRQGNSAGELQGVSSVDGKERLLAFKRVNEYPLYIGTGMDLSAVRAEVARELAWLLALGAIPFGALFFAARVGLRRTREAVDSARRLREETATRQRAEEALLQAQKLEAMGRLTGGVAHDFNNALMVISNNAYLLGREVSERGQPRLSAISRAVSSATKLTRQLLAFSRRQALLPQVVRLDETLPVSRELLAPVLGPLIRLEIEVAQGTRPIVVDLAELELALLNLCINARDAIAERGALTIRARPAGDLRPDKITGEAVVIEVIDDGPGIPPELLSKVFEPFFTTKPVGKGTGLGLSQVWGFCERAGGAATIHSAPGGGTTVRMFFPAAEAGAHAKADAPESAARPLGKSVLVVEDNDEVAAALLPLLAGLGCTATRVDGARAAREWLEARPAPPDVVLTDVIMPGDMDGIALAKWIRLRRPAQAVLLMTGYAERLDEATASGIEVLPKPFAPEALPAAIGRAGATPGHPVH